MYLGVIADDFTGGTDIAGFLVQNGLSVTQYLGVPGAATEGTLPDAAVISLKSRSCAPELAVEESLAALRWLQGQGCRQIYFKYCSTFDSTAKGNIGPVTDALLDALGSDMTVIAPALPVNGRTVYQGYLFVNDVPLDESGMRNHPVTPMRDANLMRLMEAQASGKAANIPYAVMEEGVEAIQAFLDKLRAQGIRYAIPDALNERHLVDLGTAVADMPLVTGGSGLGMGIARHQCGQAGLDPERSTEAGRPQGGRSVVLAGSASVMTNEQVAVYRKLAPSYTVDVRRCIEDTRVYAQEVFAWVKTNAGGEYAPMVYATAGPETLASIQKEFGAEASGLAIESFFAFLAAALKEEGFDHFIVAGGETSGAIVKALAVKSFHIGPQIAPGVPWVRAVDMPLSLALKSGNFGDKNFFSRAQEFFK